MVQPQGCKGKLAGKRLYHNDWVAATSKELKLSYHNGYI